eukprot:RCo041997
MLGAGGKKLGGAAKPVFLVCYLCGQQYGSASLSVHQPQCYQKKLTDWRNGDPKTRGPKPRDPASLEIEAPKAIIGNSKEVEKFNQEQFGGFTANLTPCPNCGRKFLPDRLEVHLRSCNPSASGGGSKPVRGKEFDPRGTMGAPRKSMDRSPATKPQLLVCYLCGQQFGTASLGIHQPQCYRKMLAQWENADPQTRGPKPRDPATVQHEQPVDLHDAEAVEKFNDQNFSNFKDNLSPCPNCGRTFLPDRLVVHLRSCNPGNAGHGSKPVRGKAGPPPSAALGSPPGISSVSSSEGEGGGGRPAGTGGAVRAKRAAGPAAKPVALVCYLCGQQYGTASLGIHMPQCYAKAMKIWEAADPTTRGPKPRDPSTVDLQAPTTLSGTGVEDFNNEQFSQFTDNLSPCPNCGRKFLPDRLQVHLRSCKGEGPKHGTDQGNSAKPSSSRSPLANRLPSSRGSSASPKSDEAQPGYGGDPDEGDDDGGADQEEPPVLAEPSPSGGHVGNHAVDYPDDSAEVGPLVPCSVCGRRFAAERLPKHEAACAASRQKQRKVFNSQKARAKGTEMAGNQPSLKKEVAAAKPNWRAKHQELQQAMQAARTVGKVLKEGGDLSALPPPPPAANPDYVPCPHCGRRFNAAAAERHIPKCKDTVNRPKPPPKRAAPP